MLPGFQLKCSAKKIEVFVFVIIIKFLVVPSSMITKNFFCKLKKKTKPVSKNILKNNWRAHIIHNFIQINCIVLPIGIKISSIQFSHSVESVCDPNGLQHTRLPCLSPTPRVYSNSCPSCR